MTSCPNKLQYTVLHNYFVNVFSKKINKKNIYIYIYKDVCLMFAGGCLQSVTNPLIWRHGGSMKLSCWEWLVVIKIWWAESDSELL